MVIARRIEICFVRDLVAFFASKRHLLLECKNFYSLKLISPLRIELVARLQSGGVARDGLACEAWTCQLTQVTGESPKWGLVTQVTTFACNSALTILAGQTD